MITIMMIIKIMMMEKDNRERILRLEEIIKLNSVQFSRCLLTCRINSVSAIVKATYEHKYNTQATRIHKKRNTKIQQKQ